MLRRWLDTWRGLGDIVVGMNRQGFMLTLSNIDRDTWRANFMRDPLLSPAGFGSGPTPWRAVQVARVGSVERDGLVVRRSKPRCARVSWQTGLRKGGDTMNERFASIFQHWDLAQTGDFEAFERKVRELLGHHGIRLRQDDGRPFQINWSLPESRPSSVVLGVRYRKRDGSHTEDCFVCTPEADGFGVVAYYRGSIQRKMPEYRRTHKRQVDAFDAAGPSAWPHGVPTDIRTLTFTQALG